MDVNIFQMILVIAFGFYINLDRYGLHFNLWQPVIAGCIVGLILGDVKTGLFIGGTLQLMTLGVSQFGGAAVPDYATASLVGTYISISTGQSQEIGVTLGIPVALLMVQLDVIKSTANIFFQHQAEKAAEEENYKKIEKSHWYATALTMATTGIPVLLCVLFGPKLVDLLVNQTPQWLIGGLTVAGGLLPVVGIGILLRYLPAKKYFPAVIFGFVLASYFNMPILGVALVAVGWGIHIYSNSNKIVKNNMQMSTVSANQGGIIDDDE